MILILNLFINLNFLVQATSAPRVFCDQLLQQISANTQLISPKDLASVEKWGLENFSFDLTKSLKQIGAKKWSDVQSEKLERIPRFEAFTASADLQVLAISLNSKHRLNPTKNTISVLYLDHLKKSVVSIKSISLNKAFKVRSMHIAGQAEKIYVHVEVMDDHQNSIGQKLLVYSLNKSSLKEADIFASLNPKEIAWLPSEDNFTKFILVRSETQSGPTVLIYQFNILQNKLNFLSHIDIKSRHQVVSLFNLTDPKSPTAAFARYVHPNLEIIAPDNQLKLNLTKHAILFPTRPELNIRFTQGSPFFSYLELFGDKSRGIVFNDARYKNEVILPFSPVYKKNTNIPMAYLYPLGSHTIIQLLMKEASAEEPSEWQMYFIPTAPSVLIPNLEESPIFLLLRSQKNWSHTLSLGRSLVTIENHPTGKLILQGFTLPPN